MLFLSSPCSWPLPAFSGCGHTHWDGLLVQRSVDVGMEESHARRAATSAVSIQGKFHSGDLQQQFPPPPRRCLLRWPWGTSGDGRTKDWCLGLLFFFYYFLPDSFPQPITYCAHKRNKNSSNSCWCLWALHVAPREVGLSWNTKASGLLRAQEWQKCPHAFCLWHCC